MTFRIEPVRTVQTPPRVKIAGEKWDRRVFDAHNGAYQGRVEVYYNKDGGAWHFYQRDPADPGRAELFYSPLEILEDEDLIAEEVCMNVEKCHNWHTAQTAHNWKKLAVPIEQGRDFLDMAD